MGIIRDTGFGDSGELVPLMTEQVVDSTQSTTSTTYDPTNAGAAITADLDRLASLENIKSLHLGFTGMFDVDDSQYTHSVRVYDRTNGEYYCEMSHSETQFDNVQSSPLEEMRAHGNVEIRAGHKVDDSNATGRIVTADVTIYGELE